MTLRIAWPFLPIAFVASLTVSPIMSVDSQVLASYPLTDSVTPHFPPLYPIFLRVLSAGVERLDSLLGGPAPIGGIISPAVFSYGAARAALLIQHLCALFASAYLATRISPGIGWARLATAVLYLNPVMLLLVHNLYTEALVAPAIYAALAAAGALLTATSTAPARLLEYAAWTAVGALARSPAIVIGTLVPMVEGVRWLSAVVGRRRSDARLRARRLVLASSALLAAIIVAWFANHVVMLSALIEPRAAVGRAFIYRLSPGSLVQARQLGWPSFLPGYDDASLRETLGRLKRAVDPETAKLIEVVEAAEHPWTGTFSAVQAEVKRRCPDCEPARLRLETDRSLNWLMMLATINPDTNYLWDTLLRVGQYLLPPVVSDHTDTRLAHPFGPGPWFDPVSIRSGFPFHGERVENAASPVLIAMRHWTFPVCVLVIVASMAHGRRGPLSDMALGALGVAVVYAALMSVATVYIRRYGLVVDQLAIAAAVIALTATSDARATSPFTSRPVLR
jgi:hypothetical protein